MATLCISDNRRNRLYIIDLKGMLVKFSLKVGQSPYPVDQVSQDTVFVSTRGKKSILPVNFKKGKAHPLIKLPHKPVSYTHLTLPTILLV